MYLFREFSQGPFSSTVFYELITKAKKICFRTAFAASCFSVKLMYGILVEGTSDVYEKRLFKHFLLLWKVHTLIVISLCLSYKGTVIEIVTLLCIILEKKKKKTLKVKCLYTAFKYFKKIRKIRTGNLWARTFSKSLRSYIFWWIKNSLASSLHKEQLQVYFVSIIFRSQIME